MEGVRIMLAVVYVALITVGLGVLLRIAAG